MKWRSAEMRNGRVRVESAQSFARPASHFSRVACGLALLLLAFASNLFAQNEGGVSYSDSGTFTVNTLGATLGTVTWSDSATFTVNTLGSPTGAGGVSWSDSETFTVNTLGVASGSGGVTWSDSATFTVNTLNVVSGAGGVAYADSGTFTVNTLNVASGAGGVAWSDSESFAINTLNVASGAGGVAWSDSETFTNNTLVHESGDGGMTWSDSGTFIENSLAHSSGEGGVAWSDSETFTESTLATASGEGAVAWSDSETFTVNTLTPSSGEGGVAWSDSGAFTVNTLGVTLGAVTWSDSADFVLVTAVSPYTGNGNTSFGGAVGTSTLTLSNNATTVFGTITPHIGDFTNVLVIYLDTGVGGFADTSGFNDAGNGFRQAISGIDGNGDRSLLTFTGTGVSFAPAYAIALSPATLGRGSLWQLAAGGNGSLGFVTNVNLNPVGTGTAATYSFQFNFSWIGLPPATNAESFKLLGTCIATNGFRSDEALPGNVTGTVGWNPFAATAYGVYYTVPAAVQTPGAPPLFIGLSGSTVTVSWQNVSGWILQQNTNLLDSSSWSINTNWSTSNGTNSLILTAPTGNLFFRLNNP
jgi:hypothetical protein